MDGLIETLETVVDYPANEADLLEQQFDVLLDEDDGIGPVDEVIEADPADVRDQNQAVREDDEDRG